MHENRNFPIRCARLGGHALVLGAANGHARVLGLSDTSVSSHMQLPAAWARGDACGGLRAQGP